MGGLPLRVGALAALLALLSSPPAPALAAEPHFDLAPLAPAPLPPPARHACAAGPADTAFRVLYVLPPSTLDWYEERVPLIRAGIAAATAVVLESSLPHGVDVRLKFFCDADGEVSVPKVRTTTPANAASFSTIVGELRAKGFDLAHEKYWVVYEGFNLACGGCVGQGNVFADDRASADNLNNRGAMYALTYVGNYGPAQAHLATLTNVMLHEATHVMGGVQHSAPHASGGFHCDDGADVMCYADGASGSAFTPFACPRLVVTHAGPEMPYDCGTDDYFHPDPAPGNYLATHWNVGSPMNRWIEWQRT